MIYTWSTELQQTEAEHIVAEAKFNHDTQFYRMKGGGEVLLLFDLREIKHYL